MRFVAVLCALDGFDFARSIRGRSKTSVAATVMLITTPKTANACQRSSNRFFIGLTDRADGSKCLLFLTTGDEFIAPAFRVLPEDPNDPRLGLAKDCRSIKPSRTRFERATRSFPGRPCVLFGGDSLPCDSEPAEALGLATAWINPQGERSPHADYVLRSLLEIEKKGNDHHSREP